MNAIQMTPIDTARDHAARCLAASDGGTQEATDRLMRIVQEDDALFRLVMMPMLREACRSLVGLVSRAHRKAVWTGAESAVHHNPKPGKSIALSLVSATVRGLMDFPLPGGKRLGDASKGEVEAAQWSYRTQADDMNIKARWLQMIASRLHPNDVVSKVLTEADLEAMRTKARNV